MEGLHVFNNGMNMGNIMKQAKKMQEQMVAAQTELEQKTFEATSGGGAVKVTVNGHKKLLDIKISPDATEDVDMLQDLIISAVNEAIRQANEASGDVLGKITNGNLPNGLF